MQIILKSRFIRITIFCSMFLFEQGFSQDIEPRRWASLPLGTNVVGAGYAHTFGDIFLDPLLQAEDVSVNINAFLVSYVRPFKIANKLARIDVTLPYAIAKWEGLLAGEPTTVYRNGFVDPRIRFSINLFGPPPNGPKELQEYFKDHPVNTTLGVSIAVKLPLGQYYNDKLLNLGQNQFVIVPQIGVVHNWNRWSYEFTGSAIFYGDNPDFFGGKKKKQDPTLAFQTHLIRQFKPGYWASISAAYGLGGQSIVNRQPNADNRQDLQGAFSFGFPVSKYQGMKLAYVRSETLRDIGSNLNVLILGWSLLF
jgi:hypothetical protein